MINSQKGMINYNHNGRMSIRMNGVYAILQTNGERFLVQPIYKIEQTLKKYQRVPIIQIRLETKATKKPIIEAVTKPKGIRT